MAGLTYMRKRKVNKKSPKPQAASLYDGATRHRQPGRTIYINDQFATAYKFNVNDSDWKTILSKARDLYSNLACVGGAINELSDLAVGDAWKPVYTGQNKVWGEQATQFLNRWMEICDTRGEPFSLQIALKNAATAIMRDGDVLCLLTATADGKFPQIQWISAEQIGSRNNASTVKGGQFDGYEIANGVITNRLGQTVGYNILGESEDGSDDVQVMTLDAQLVCDPVWIGQNRGLSALASAIQPFSDYKEIVQAEIKSVKAASNFALQFYIPEEQQANFAGEDGDNPYATPVANVSGSNSKSLTVETMQLGGESLIFKPDSGAKVEVLESDRPSQNTSKFLTDLVLRNCFQSLRIPSEFAFQLDSGGSTTRLVTGKVQRRVEQIQAHILRPVWLRIVRYAISKAMKYGYLPKNADIIDAWSWQPTYPREITVDNGRDTKADLDLYSKGIYNGSILAAQYGYDYPTVLEQKAQEMALANELGKKYNVDPNLLVMATPNGNVPATQNNSESTDTTSTINDTTNENP